PSVRLNLGMAYNQAEKWELAKQALTKGLELGEIAADLVGTPAAVDVVAPFSAALSQRELGKACRAQEDTKEALAAFEKALELEPAYTDLWQGVGELRAELGDPAGSADAYYRAAEAFVSDLDVQRTAGRVL